MKKARSSTLQMTLFDVPTSDGTPPDDMPKLPDEIPEGYSEGAWKLKCEINWLLYRYYGEVDEACLDYCQRRAKRESP